MVGPVEVAFSLRQRSDMNQAQLLIISSTTFRYPSSILINSKDVPVDDLVRMFMETLFEHDDPYNADAATP